MHEVKKGTWVFVVVVVPMVVIVMVMTITYKKSLNIEDRILC